MVKEVNRAFHEILVETIFPQIILYNFRGVVKEEY